MKLRYTPIKKRSRKKILRDICGKLHLEYLKLKRKNDGVCELCGRRTTLGRFHIIAVSQSCKFEFIDQNVLLTCWMPCHYGWHHYGKNHPKVDETMKKIIKLRGENYEENIKIMALGVGTLNESYYELLAEYFRQEIKRLKNNRL